MEVRSLTENGQKHDRRAWLVMGICLILMIGLRHEVGGDWYTYAEIVNHLHTLDLAEALRTSDPAFAFLGWMSQFYGGDYFVNLICAAIFCIGLIHFCRSQPHPWLAMVIAIPYLVIVVAMGYSRQAVAIGLVLIGIVEIHRGNLRRFLIWTAFAALFHKSAVILMGLAFFSRSQRRWSTGIGILTVAVLCFILLLQESLEYWRVGYIDSGMESSGAAIRVAMNAIPAALFLALRGRFNLNPLQQDFWTWTSISALLFVPLLVLSPSSTAVDRIALYWVPTQLFILSRLPMALTSNRKSIRTYTGMVICYSAMVQFVWLFFATHSFAWLPYRFYPIELLRGFL